MAPNTDYIHTLIAEGEHQTQDFKYKISDACKIARTLSAFANTDGGRLLIGVRDDGSVAGVRSAEEMFMVQAAGEKFCTPCVPCTMKSFFTEGDAAARGRQREVVVAQVEPSTSRPVMALLEDGTSRAFLRRADENILATPVHLALWREEAMGEGAIFPFDDRERRLLTIFDTNSPITLNQFTRLACIPRHQAVNLLAHFIRFGLLRMQFIDHKFVYSTMK
jgi:hypothetical protein